MTNKQKPGYIETIHTDGTKSVLMWGNELNPFEKCPPITGCPNITVREETPTGDFNTSAQPKLPVDKNTQKHLLSLYKSANAPGVTATDRFFKLGQLLEESRFVLTERSDLSFLPPELQGDTIPFLNPKLREQVRTLGNQYLDSVYNTVQEAVDPRSSMPTQQRIETLRNIDKAMDYIVGSGQSADLSYSRINTTLEQVDSQLASLKGESYPPVTVAPKI